jgi:hypothetical protein
MASVFIDAMKIINLLSCHVNRGMKKERKTREKQKIFMVAKNLSQ